MSATRPGVLARNPWVVRRPLTVIEFHRMGEVGILGEDDRVELIEGELVAMAPIGSDHYGTVATLTHLLVGAVGDQALVGVQGPVRLGEHTEPQPDFAVLKPRSDNYRARLPGPADILLLIEVALSSVTYDKSVKAPLYARSGIAEYWLVRLDTTMIEVYRSPSEDGYQLVEQVGPDATLEIQQLPGVFIPAAKILR